MATDEFLSDVSIRMLDMIGGLRRAFLGHQDANWQDALSTGQITSKLWLVDTLEALGLDLGTTFVLGGWYGTLPSLLFQRNVLIERIVSFDIDPACAPIAEDVNRENVMRNWRFKAATADIIGLDYTQTSFVTHRRDGTTVDMTLTADTLINTSCDHIHPFSDWFSRIPTGKLVVLQNNDFVEADETHTNTVKSLEEFQTMAPMREVLYSGEIVLPQYKRFMIIGRT